MKSGKCRTKNKDRNPREGIPVSCKRETVTLELIWKRNEPIPGDIETSGKGLKI